MEESNKNSILGYYSFGADKVTDEGKQKGFSYKTSMSLIENVIAKKEPPLLSDLNADKNMLITKGTKQYTGKRGENVKLTPFQMKLITALAQVIDTLTEKKENKEYIKSLPYRIEDREKGDDGQTKKLPDAIKTTIDLVALTKMMYSTNEIGGKQLNKVKAEMVKLSEICRAYKFMDSRGGTLTIEAPLITLGKKIKYETKEGIVKLNKVEVTFEDVFVYEINERYCLCPITILQLWNETGVQTEIFAKLLFTLQELRGNFISHSKDIVTERRKELKKAKVETQQIEEELTKLRRDTLTYKEGITSLLKGIEKYNVISKKGKKYLNRAKLNKDLQQAKDALLRMGIISEYYETTGSSGEKVCNFVINDNWLINEADKIKRSLPTN